MRLVMLRLALAAALLAAVGCSGADQSAPVPTGGGIVSPSPSPEASVSPDPAEVPTTEGTAPAPSPTVTSSPDAPATEDPGEGVTQVTAYYVRSGADRLWVEPEVRTLDEPTVAVATAALTELLAGEPQEPGLARPVTEPVEVLGADLDDGLLTVNVSPAIVDAGDGSAAELALREAIGHTATQFDTVDRVLLQVDGATVTDLWGHLDWSQPFEPDPFAVSPIDITEPGPGATLPPGPVTVGGTANTFEATVELRLLGPDGEVVEEGFTTATCGTGCRGTWEHTFDTEATPGIWTVEAIEPDPSGGEGRAPFTASREITVGG